MFVFHHVCRQENICQSADADAVLLVDEDSFETPQFIDDPVRSTGSVVPECYLGNIRIVADQKAVRVAAVLEHQKDFASF